MGKSLIFVETAAGSIASKFLQSFCRALWFDDVVPYCKEHQLGDVLEVVLSHDVGTMCFYGFYRDGEHISDLPVAVAFGQQF